MAPKGTRIRVLDDPKARRASCLTRRYVDSTCKNLGPRTRERHSVIPSKARDPGAPENGGRPRRAARAAGRRWNGILQLLRSFRMTGVAASP
jgi:hypothetical protein